MNKDLNLRPNTIKLLEKNTGRTLFDINYSNIFPDPLPRAMIMKTKIKRKEKQSKGSINKMKRQEFLSWLSRNESD